MEMERENVMMTKVHMTAASPVRTGPQMYQASL